MSGRARRDLAGTMFGQMKVVGRVEIDRPGEFWLCNCLCGGTKIAERSAITSASFTSCGCLQRIAVRAAAQRRDLTSKKRWRRPRLLLVWPAEAPSALSGSSPTALYKGKPISFFKDERGIWYGMLRRCGYTDAGADTAYLNRGIEVCQRWRDGFANFLEDMGPRPDFGYSIDRKDGNSGYSPGNCRWATRAEQAANRRSSHMLDVAGERLCLTQAAREYGISVSLLRLRLKKGWTTEMALLKPQRKYTTKNSDKRPDPDFKRDDTFSYDELHSMKKYAGRKRL